MRESNAVLQTIKFQTAVVLVLRRLQRLQPLLQNFQGSHGAKDTLPDKSRFLDHRQQAHADQKEDQYLFETEPEIVNRQIEDAEGHTDDHRFDQDGDDRLQAKQRDILATLFAGDRRHRLALRILRAGQPHESDALETLDQKTGDLLIGVRQRDPDASCPLQQDVQARHGRDDDGHRNRGHGGRHREQDDRIQGAQKKVPDIGDHRGDAGRRALQFDADLIDEIAGAHAVVIDHRRADEPAECEISDDPNELRLGARQVDQTPIGKRLADKHGAKRKHQQRAEAERNP